MAIKNIKFNSKLGELLYIFEHTGFQSIITNKQLRHLELLLTRFYQECREYYGYKISSLVLEDLESVKRMIWNRKN